MQKEVRAYGLYRILREEEQQKHRFRRKPHLIVTLLSHGEREEAAEMEAAGMFEAFKLDPREQARERKRAQKKQNQSKNMANMSKPKHLPVKAVGTHHSLHIPYVCMYILIHVHICVCVDPLYVDVYMQHYV